MTTQPPEKIRGTMVKQTSANTPGSAAILAALSVSVVLVLAAVPLVTDRRDLLNLLFLVYLSVCLGQSWNILGGFVGQVNLGHAAVFGIGALVARNLWAVQ